MLWNSKWFPGTNLQDINLDWILKKVSALRGGTVGQYLYKKSDKDFDFGWKTGSGGGGGTSDYLDLDNKPSINNVELTGNKTASDLGLATPSDIPVVPVQSVNGKTGAVELVASDVGAYVKPAAGIPKTDLSSAVQESLDKAESAYTKPAEGIPKTDLSTDVQTSLNKADTALQAVPSTYRTAASQDVIDAAQNAQIVASAKADEIAIVITGARPSNTVTEGQYVIVRNSTISGIADGLYTANSALSPSTDVTATNLTAVSNGGFNNITLRSNTAPTILEQSFTSYSAVNKMGHIAICTIDLQNGSLNISSGGWYNIATIPDGFLPDISAGYSNIGTTQNSSNVTTMRAFQIQSNGNVRVSILSGTYTRLYCNIVYFCK